MPSLPRSSRRCPTVSRAQGRISPGLRSAAMLRAYFGEAFTQSPDRSGLPSGARGDGAARFGFPSAVRGIAGVRCASHCAAGTALEMMMARTVTAQAFIGTPLPTDARSVKVGPRADCATKRRESYRVGSFQFRITEIGLASATALVTRKRWPSGAGSKVRDLAHPADAEQRRDAEGADLAADQGDRWRGETDCGAETSGARLIEACQQRLVLAAEVVVSRAQLDDRGRALRLWPCEHGMPDAIDFLPALRRHAPSPAGRMEESRVSDDWDSADRFTVSQGTSGRSI